MSFLGIGPFELLLLLVIATVVLGPERMAQAGRTLGRLYARYRLRWQKDVDEMTRELRRELALLQQEVDQIKQTAESEIKTAQAALEQAVSAEIDSGPATGTTDTAQSRTDGEQERRQMAEASGQEPGSAPPVTGIDEV
jgi:Sec-independent protein translocase protein TatA